MPELAFDEIVLPTPAEDSFDEIILPRESSQFDQIILPKQPETEPEKALAETPVFNPKNEQISAAPTFLGELHAGRIGSAYHLAKEFVANAMAPTQKIEPGRGQGLLGTTEQIPPDPNDSLPMRAAKAVINVTNRTAAGLTTPDMLPLAVIGGSGGAASRILAGAFGANIASNAPETWQAIQEADKTQPWSQERLEAGLDTVLQGLMLHGAAKHAATNRAPVRLASEPEATAATTEPPAPETMPSVTADVRDVPPEARPEQRLLEFSHYGKTVSEWTDAAIERYGDTEKALAFMENERKTDHSVKRFGPSSKMTGLVIEELRKRNEAPSVGRGNDAGAREGFRPSTEWQEIPEGTVLPNGGEYRFDQKSGKNFARWKPENLPADAAQANRQQSETFADTVAQDQGQYATRSNQGGEMERPTSPTSDVPLEVQPASQPEVNPTSTKNATTSAQPIGVTEPEIMSPGPGAASAKESLASYELRRFGKRFQETEGIDPAIREETGSRYYEPIPNKVTLEDASKIIDERGTDEAIRLVRDEKFEMEPRVRATLGQTLVQKLNQSHAEATAAGDTARAKSFLDQAVDTAEYLGEFGTRLGQGVQSFAIWSRLTPEGMLESAKRSAKRANVELTPEQQAEIRRLAAEAHAAAEGIPKQDATKKLADYMVQQTGIPAKDLPLSIYYTHILSGVQTHIVNAVDTALNVMHEVNNLAVTNPRAAASIYSGLMRGLGEGKYDGLLSLQEGRRIASGKFVESPDLLEQSRFGKKGGVPIADTGKISRITKKVAESKIATPLNAYKYVMRMMSASDAVFFRGAEEARAGLLAHRIAEATGTERAKLKIEVDSILGYDRLPEFRERAAKEGYTGAKQEARATELMIQSRPESLRADAADYAGVSTYNHAPRGVLGYFSNQIAQISNKYPALKLFVPFTRIVANVTNRGLDNTPLGIYRSLKEKGLSKEERQRVLTRGVMGTAGLMGLGVLNATGLIQIHGAGPHDLEKNKQLRAAGWKPFSLQIGDKYFTYTYTPIGLGLSILGNYLDSDRYNELSQKDALTRVVYAMSSPGQTIFSQSFLSGLSNLFTILSGDPGRSISALKNFFSAASTGITTPNLIRDINHIFDPSARKSENIAQDLIRNIPVARLSLRPVLNAFGEPVEVSRNRFFSAQDDDPAWKLAVNKNLRIPVVDQTTFVDSEDGYLYAKIAGERMRKYIVNHLAELNRLPDEKAQDMLSKASRSMFDEARQDVVRHGGVKKKKKR